MTPRQELLPRIRRNVLPTFSNLQNELDRLYEGFFGPQGTPTDLLPDPSLDVTDDDGEIRVEMEAPGVDEKDVEVDVTDDGTLSIRGEKRAESETERHGRRWSERSFGRFERVIPLPSAVQAEKSEATFDKGVLTVRLPKSKEAPERIKRVPVKS